MNLFQASDFEYSHSDRLALLCRDYSTLTTLTPEVSLQYVVSIEDTLRPKLSQPEIYPRPPNDLYDQTELDRPNETRDACDTRLDP